MPNIAVLPIPGIATLLMGSIMQNQPLMVGKPGASTIEHSTASLLLSLLFSTVFISFYY